MKLPSPILPVFLACASLCGAQETLSSDSSEKSTPLAPATSARILGKIADGTPAPSSPPKPRYSIDQRDVRKVVTHNQGGRTITIREINPIDLPTPPIPTAAALSESDTAFSQQLADQQSKSGYLMMGATVYRFPDGSARTLVRCWSGRGGEPMTFWSSADFALIAGGFHSYADSNGITYSLLMACGDGYVEDSPEIPEFATGQASFQIIGKQPATQDLLVAIESLHEVYNRDYEQLKDAHAAREQARIERQAYLKANPPQPKDITLNFWRIERTASKNEGGDQ